MSPRMEESGSTQKGSGHPNLSGSARSIARLSSRVRQLYPAILAILFAFAIGGALLLLGGHDPLQAYWGLLKGGLGSKDRLAETLVKTTPFLIIGIAISMAFKCQVWNIGVEGQFIIGAIFAGWVGLQFANMPTILLLPLTLGCGFLGGALWGLIAGVLKAKLEANEIITTTMLNYVAIYLLGYLVRGPMMDPEGFNFPQSPLIGRNLFLPRLISGTRLNLGFMLALLLVALALVFWRTSFGFRTEIVGASRRVARYVGLDVSRTIMLIMILSGGLAGIAGWSEIFGIHHRLIDEIARGYGSAGIVVALLGELHPIGIAVASVLFAALVVGGNAMERSAGVPFALVDVIQGLVILFVLSRSWLAREVERK